MLVIVLIIEAYERKREVPVGSLFRTSIPTIRENGRGRNDGCSLTAINAETFYFGIQYEDGMNNL